MAQHRSNHGACATKAALQYRGALAQPSLPLTISRRITFYALQVILNHRLRTNAGKP